jgi:hypothetical protein
MKGRVIMEWSKMFPGERKPTMEDIAEYIGGDARELWESLINYMERAYKAAPKLSYSVCSGKPGWNVKFQKSGQSFGTLYPEENSFSVFIVISYKLAPVMDEVINTLSEETAEIYRQAGDYMKLGKWMMFQIKDGVGVEDYKKLMSVKLAPNAV